ncbi:MAG: hypothetical protein ACREIA_27045, partial [Opitutaceae bacterium]
MNVKTMRGVARLLCRVAALSLLPAPVLSEASNLGLPRIDGADGQIAINAAKYERWETDDTPSRLESGRTWEIPFRRSTTKELYVTLGILASRDSSIRVGPLTFRLQADAKGNFVDLYYSGSRESKVWKPTGIATRLQEIGGTTIAVLPVLTLRFEEGTRDVLIYAAMSFMGLLSLDEDNPAMPGSDRIEVTPGPDGAWIVNVTQSDENPLFPDSNHNGVDDDFEGAVAHERKA